MINSVKIVEHSTIATNLASNKSYLRFVVALAFFFTVYPAHADIALPTLVFTLPGMLMALIPVIVVETSITSRMLNRSYLSTIKTVSIANIITTFVGIPLSSAFHLFMFWILGGFRQSTSFETAISLFAPGAIIYEYHYPEPRLEYLAISLVLLVACIISIIIELIVYVKMLRGYTKRTLLNASILSNIGSYILLLIAVFVFLQHINRITGDM